MENLMYHAKALWEKAQSQQYDCIDLCSFTLIPLRQMGISEGILSLFWTIAAISVGKLESFCLGLNCNSIYEGKLKRNILGKENIYRLCKTRVIEYNPPFQLSSYVWFGFFPKPSRNRCQ